uniref:Uncharacterized protein n=1 Tax=Rhizophora mucronata TaxID=61149 RepID=A0A2P2NYZ2_RHIMU
MGVILIFKFFEYIYDLPPL